HHDCGSRRLVTDSAHLVCTFSDNALIQELVGPHNVNLLRLEERLGVALHSRGNTIIIEGPADSAAKAQTALRQLYGRLEGGHGLERGDVDGVARMAANDGGNGGAGGAELSIRTRKRHIVPRSPGQRAYFEALANNELVF